MNGNSSSTTHFDCLIIGGGPAGLTAALTVARQRHTAAVFDSGEYHNAGTPHMHTVPTWDHKQPAEFRAATRKNTLENYQTVTYFDKPVASVRANKSGSTKTQDCFELTTKDTTYYGAKLLLASGVEDVFPDIPGYAEAWPKGIFHCLFCHGYEERDAASCGVLAVGPVCSSAPVALHVARSALQLVKSVVIYTNGDETLAKEVDELVGEARPRVSIDARRIARLEKSPKDEAVVTLHFDDGSSAAEGFLAHMPPTVPRGKFIESLGVEMAQGVVATKNAFLETSVRGVFAAGDLVSQHKIFNNAVFMGSAAGGGMAMQLQADNLGHKPIGGL